MKNFISSASAANFSSGDEFLAFANERENNTQWREESATGLTFRGLQEEPIMAPAVAHQYNCNAEAIEECMGKDHSGLILQFPGKAEAAPVGDSAIATIRERMCVRNGFWVRQRKNPDVIAKDCNSSFGMMTKTQCLIKVADEMVRAVLSSRYAIITVPTVYRLATEFLQNRFPEATFLKGYYSHSFCTMTWSLEKYRDDLLGKSGKVGSNKNILPILFVQTSDVSASSVVIRPKLMVGAAECPLAMREDTRHLGRSEKVEERVQNSFEVVMAKFTDAVKDVEKLDTVTLTNPYNTLLRVFKKIQWPREGKAAAMESADNFKQLIGGSTLTAYDAYMAIVDAYGFLLRDCPNTDPNRYEDAIARSIRLDWKDYDLPGDFSY